MEELKVYEDKMNKTLDVLLSDYGTIRAGRANPHVLDKIRWTSLRHPTSPAGWQCFCSVFPEMTEERRKEVSKDVKKKGDNAKVALRNIRRDANEAFKKAEKAGDISEDDLTEMTEKMQKLTDKMVEKVDKAVEEKTKEIMTV